MMQLKTLLAAVALAAAAHAAPAQSVGSTVDTLELADFAQTGATSYDDLIGRAVLIEFFAYW